MGPPGYFSTSSVEAVWAGAAEKAGAAAQRTESVTASAAFTARRKGGFFIFLSLKKAKKRRALQRPHYNRSARGPPGVVGHAFATRVFISRRYARALGSSL